MEKRYALIKFWVEYWDGGKWYKEVDVQNMMMRFGI